MLHGLFLDRILPYFTNIYPLGGYDTQEVSEKQACRMDHEMTRYSQLVCGWMLAGGSTCPRVWMADGPIWQSQTEGMILPHLSYIKIDWNAASQRFGCWDERFDILDPSRSGVCRPWRGCNVSARRVGSCFDHATAATDAAVDHLADSSLRNHLQHHLRWYIDMSFLKPS